MPCEGDPPTFSTTLTVTKTAACEATLSIDVTVPCGSSGYSVAFYKRFKSSPKFLTTELISTSSVAGDGTVTSDPAPIPLDGDWFFGARVECDGSPHSAVEAEISDAINFEECEDPDPDIPAIVGIAETHIQQEGVDELIFLVQAKKQAGSWVYTDKRVLSRTYQMIDWFYYRRGGCGGFQLLIRDRFSERELALSQSWEVHVRIKLDGESSHTTWYRGVIRSVRTKYQGNEVVTIISGTGYVEQLASVMVQRRYPKGLTIRAIVGDLLDNYIKPNTRILNSSRDSGMDTLGYTVNGPIHFECSVLKALKFLSELQGSTEFGVAADRQFYFRSKSTNPKDHIFLENDTVNVIDGGARIDKINKVKVGGKNWGHKETLHIYEDVTDVTEKGMFERPIEVPWVEHDTDAHAWALNKVAEHKGTKAWKAFYVANVDRRYERNHADNALDPIRVYLSDVSNEKDDYDIDFIHYFKGGFQHKSEVREIRDAKHQTLLDQPQFRAEIHFGRGPRDLVGQLEELFHDPILAMQGKLRQYRDVQKDTTHPDPGLQDVQGGMIAAVVQGADVTNDAMKMSFRDASRWSDFLSMLLIDSTTPAAGDFVGQHSFVFSDPPTRSKGTLYHWNGEAWVASGAGAAAGGGGGASVGDDVRDVTNTNISGVSALASREDHQHRGVREVGIYQRPSIGILGRVDVTTVCPVAVRDITNGLEFFLEPHLPDPLTDPYFFIG